MKKRVHINSITAFHELKDQFPRRQLEILEIIWNNPKLSVYDISAFTTIPISSITARINELMHKQSIRVGAIEIVNGRPRNRYMVRFESDPLNTFSHGLQDRLDLFLSEMKEALKEEEERPRLINVAEAAKSIRKTLDNLVEKNKLSES